MQDIGLRSVERDLGGALEARLDDSKSFDDPRPEEDGVVVRRVDRHPRERPFVEGAPLMQQRRLPEPGRRRKQYEWLPRLHQRLRESLTGQ
jgi:hypothetical protein